MKRELIDKLLEVLEQEYKVYEDILRLSKDKTNIIVEGKVSELDNIVKLEQALVMQIARIDQKREEILQQICNETDSGEKTMNISEIKKHTSEAQSKRLEEYQGKMLGIVDELGHINKLNSKLIQNSLEFIEFSLNLMANADAASNNYGKKGDSSNKSRKNLIDMKL